LWLLNRCRVDWLRADALGMLHGLIDRLDESEPEPHAADAHYALSLRSGWKHEDLAVVMSSSSSPMNHLPPDGGTLAIGSHGRWLIDDPGYQQYMKKTERTFTVGPTAHNGPIINGQAQTQRLCTRAVAWADAGDELSFASVDLTAGYPDDLNLEVVARTVWLKGRLMVVVADQISGQGVERITYCWHGHPDAAWWTADNWARIYFPDATLWLSSPQARIGDADVERLPGSRGQLTLRAQVANDSPVIWWVFALSDRAPAVSLRKAGRVVDVNGTLFDVGERYLLQE
jgi:hypothetical protein